MKRIRFTVPGRPQGKARARTGYNPKAGRVTSYTPDHTVLYENHIKTCYMQETDMAFADGEPLAVSILACFEPVKSVSKKQRAMMLQHKVFPTKKPDIDNIVKAVLDALNGLAYKDDTQVVKVMATKIYDGNARVEVRIEELTEK